MDGLLPQTEYEFQVLGICGSLNGVPSETVSMATSEAPLVSITCGAGPGAFDLENQAPLEELDRGDVFRAGDVEVTALDVKGGNGTFSGTGLAEMPWLRNVKLRVEFSGIFLNTDYQLLRGSVKSVFNPDSKMIVNLDGMDDLFKGRKEDEEGEGEGAIELETNEEIVFEGVIDSVYVDEKGEIVIIDTEGERTVYAQAVDPVTGEKQAVNIVDGEGNGYVVDGGGKVTLASENKGNVDGMRIGQPDQREELIAEILQYLQHTIIAWQDDNATALPECMPANNDLLNPVLVQINNYEDKPSELLSKFSKIDQSILIDHISTYNKAENPVRYQDILIESDWQTIICRTYSYLNDLAQGIGGVADVSADKAKLEGFISDYRAAYKQGALSFTFSSANFGDVYPTDYYIKGVSSIQLGLVDKRENNDYEPSLSLGYVSEDVTGQKEIAGTNFESSTVFQFGKPNWNFMDGPKFLLYGYHSEPAKGLDSKILLRDYLPGKYDYEAVQGFINKIIDSHDKGEESLDMKGELEGQQVYARNVDFGDKGIYDLYISRTGDFKKDDNSSYSYTKTEVSEVFGFTGSYSEYKFYCKSGGVTYIVVPQSQSTTFESSVLKLHSISSGIAHIDLVNAIRAANLNAENKLDITEYGSDGGLSPVFEINHDGEKLKLMVAYPLLGNKKNKIDPSKRPEPTTGQTGVSTFVVTILLRP